MALARQHRLISIPTSSAPIARDLVHVDDGSAPLGGAGGGQISAVSAESQAGDAAAGRVQLGDQGVGNLAALTGTAGPDRDLDGL